MPKAVKADEALLNRLFLAQLEHTANYCHEPHLSDDGLDYISSALDVASVLTHLYTENDTLKLGEWLNSPESPQGDALSPGIYPLASYATDGICEDLYDLDCPALPKE